MKINSKKVWFKNRLLAALTLIVLSQFVTSLAFAFGENSASEKSVRAKMLQTLKKEEMIIYTPKETKAVVTIFTDMDCGYCRKLHHDIPKLLELGIELRYMAYPRQGIGSPSYNKLVGIWSAEDPRDALTKSQEGQVFFGKDTKSPVEHHFMIGRQWGIRGTPTLVFADGTVWPGYLSPDTLARDAIKHTPKNP